MIESRLRSAVVWSAAEAMLRVGAQFAVGMVLARWVSPSEFGVYALLMAIVAFAGLLADGGLAHALIQRQDHSREDECTVFWFGVAAAALAAVALVFSGDWIAGYFELPRVVPLMWIGGGIVILMALQSVPTALASKQLDFRTQAHASWVAVLVAGALALWLAHEGAGVWALAWQAAATAGIQTGMLWFRIGWRPAFVFRFSSLKRLLGFGGFLLLSNLINTVVSRLHLVLIGRLFGSADLGQFTRAATTKDAPQAALAGMFSRVAFTVFSEEASNPVALRHSLRQSIVAMMALNLPLMAGLAVLADLVVPVAFGPNWDPSIPLLQVLCIVGALWPLQIANVQALLGLGESRLLFRTEILKKTILVVVTLFASSVGVQAIAWGFVLSSLVAHAVNAHFSHRFLGYGYLAQVRDILPYGGLTLIMCACILVLGEFVATQSEIERLVMLSAAGATFYLVALRASGLEAWRLIRGLLRISAASNAAVP